MLIKEKIHKKILSSRNFCKPIPFPIYHFQHNNLSMDNSVQKDREIPGKQNQVTTSWFKNSKRETGEDLRCKT